MNVAIKPAPVRKHVVVKAPPQRAFEVFTLNMGRWWHPEHKIGASPIVDVVVEPRTGGRWYERGEDGSESNWGKVLVWDPPRRVVLAWQVNAEWSYDPALVTEVEISFTPEPGGTRVDLEHRNIERFGATAEDVRGMLDSEGGWTTSLARFAEAINSTH